MPLAEADIAASPSLALRAQNNLQRNAAALCRPIGMPVMSFRLARDGALTGFDGNWLSGCSVPRRAAEVMLRLTNVEGNVACLVLPNHACQIVACLGRVAPNVVVIALLASPDQLPAMLACHDFSAEISNLRLMFAWDEASLRQIFDDHPGLPLPQQFVRLATSPGEVAEPAMKMAQAVFAPVLQAQAKRIIAARQTPPRLLAGLCVIGAQRFRLWDDAGAILADIAGGETVDTDIPARSASAHLAERIAASRAVLTANAGRGDRPELSEFDRPWICWATQSRVPAYAPRFPSDGLLIADPSLAAPAAAAGWPADRVRVAGFPVNRLPPANSQTLAIIANLPSLDAPKLVCDFSSWRVAWDTIAANLQADPLQLGNDAGAYLDRFLRKHDVADENLPRDVFLHQLIAGAFLLGIARLLKRHGASPAIHGDGWAAHADEFDVRGPVENRAALRTAISHAGCLVDACMGPASYALRAVDRPLLRPAGMTLPALIARLWPAGNANRTASDVPPLSCAAIESLLAPIE